MQNNLFGVIDIGSNTIRLVLFNKKEAGFSEVQNLKIPARLRSYMSDDQVISEAGVEVILDSLKKFQEITRYHQVETVDVVATAAVRQAKNRSKIIEKAKSETDYSIRILSEKEEAYYGYLSVIHTTNVTNGYTVDMGGGSTEVTLIEDGKMIAFHSFPFGALSLFDRFIKEEKPGKQELNNLSDYVKEQFASIPWLTSRNLPVVGIGGSARNMALIHHAENDYPLTGIHHYELPVKDIDRIFNNLLHLTLSERKKLDGLSKDRADIIIPAVHALNELSSYVAADSFITCQKGLREGVLYHRISEMNQLDSPGEPRKKAVHHLIKRYGINQHNISIVKRIAESIMEKLQTKDLVALQPTFKELLELAASVFYLGERPETDSSSHHTFYLLSNTSVEGMNHRDRVAFALLASFKNRSSFRKYIQPFSHWYSSSEIDQLELLGSVMKLSYFLNVTNRDVIEDITLETDEDNDELLFTFICKEDAYFEESKSSKQKKHLEKSLNKTIRLLFA